jgi:glycosyltransferase involved in cell wall biosynthesis
MMSCTVSVIIPTFNHRDHVLATLDSVFKQTFTDYEVIVVNDGSHDDTGVLLKSMVDAGRIRYFEQENQGQASARNLGIRAASGCYVALLDDDDIWPPYKLAWQVACLKRNPAAVVSYGYYLDLDGGYPWPSSDAPHGDVYDQFRAQCWIRSPGQTLIRRDTLMNVGGFDERVWGADDWDLYIRLSKLGHFAYEHRCALRYRTHAGNASRNTWRLFSNADCVLRRHNRPVLLRWFNPAYRAGWANLRLTLLLRCVGEARELRRQGRRWASLLMWMRIYLADPRRFAPDGLRQRWGRVRRRWLWHRPEVSGA